MTRTASPASAPDAADARDASEATIILADIAHFETKFAHNEEVGEKRLNYFLTLVTAAVAGLVALHTADPSPEVNYSAVTTATLSLLWLMGVVTYFRMLQRNAVTDQYKQTLDDLRDRYAKLSAAGDYRVPTPMRKPWHDFFRGGLADTAAAITALTSAALVYHVFPAPVGSTGDRFPDWLPAIGTGAAVLFAMVAAARRRKVAKADQTFRANVGAVICDSEGRVLSLERRDHPGAWQLPQGGLEVDEEPAAAVLREVEEETGITAQQLEPLGPFPGNPLAYELPPDKRSRKTGRGQVQYWYFFGIASGTAPKLPPSGEFRSFDWREFAQVAADAASFRRKGYGLLAEHFEREVRSRITAPT